MEEAGADFKDGLEVDLEVAVRQRGADEHLKELLAREYLIQLLVEEVDAAPFLAGFREGEFRVGDEGARGGAVMGRDADPDVEVAGVFEVFEGEDPVEGPADGGGELLRLFAGSAGQDDEEVVAAGAVQTALGDEAGDGQAHVLEEQIALGVAERLVEQLEVADVQQDDGAGGVVLEEMLKVLERGLPVGDVEQGVVVGHVLQLAGVEHALGDVGAADEVDHFVVEPADFLVPELEIELLAVLFDEAVLPVEDGAAFARLFKLEKGAVAERTRHALGAQAPYLLVREQDFVAQGMDDEEVGVHVVHDGPQGFAHLLLFAAAFLLDEFGIQPEAVGGLLVEEVDAGPQTAGFGGAFHQPGEAQGVVGGDGDAEREGDGVLFAVEGAGGREHAVQVAGEVGHFAQGFILICEEEKGFGPVVDGHVVFAGDPADDRGGVLEVEVAPAFSPAEFDFVEVAELDEDQGLKIEPGEQIAFNNGPSGLKRVQRCL